MSDNAVGALAIFCIFGLPLAGWIASRYFAHRERMALIERGMTPPSAAWEGAFKRAARAAQQPPHVTPGYVVDDEAQASLHKGIRMATVGLALFIGLSFIGYHREGGSFGGPTIEPGPWLIGGLVPLFIGIAQIIIAVLSGATLGPRRRTTMPPGAPPPPPPPGPASGGGYGSADRSRSPWEELAKPAPPPEQR